MGAKRFKRRLGRQAVVTKDFCVAEEIRYIQRRAAEFAGRFVTIGPLALFSTETGDAWLLDPSDHLAARVAREGTAEGINLEETETNFSIRWPGKYRISGDLFVFTDRDTGRVVSIEGYPTDRIAALG